MLIKRSGSFSIPLSRFSSEKWILASCDFEFENLKKYRSKKTWKNTWKLIENGIRWSQVCAELPLALGPKGCICGLALRRTLWVPGSADNRSLLYEPRNTGHRAQLSRFSLQWIKFVRRTCESRIVYDSEAGSLERNEILEECQFRTLNARVAIIRGFLVFFHTQKLTSDKKMETDRIIK